MYVILAVRVARRSYKTYWYWEGSPSGAKITQIWHLDVAKILAPTLVTSNLSSYCRDMSFRPEDLPEGAINTKEIDGLWKYFASVSVDQGWDYRIEKLSNADISDFSVYRRVYRIEPPISSISIFSKPVIFLSFFAENSPKIQKIPRKFRKPMNQSPQQQQQQRRKFQKFAENSENLPKIP